MHETVAMAELKPGNLVDGIQVDFGTQCLCDSSQWYLGEDKESPDDWALKVTMQSDGDYSFGFSESTLDITLKASKVVSESDLFWGFGDGNKYITFVNDFDGGLHVGTGIKGIFIYPPCGGPLADGDISTILGVMPFTVMHSMPSGVHSRFSMSHTCNLLYIHHLCTCFQGKPLLQVIGIIGTFSLMLSLYSCFFCQCIMYKEYVSVFRRGTATICL